MIKKINLKKISLFKENFIIFCIYFTIPILVLFLMKIFKSSLRKKKKLFNLLNHIYVFVYGQY